MIPLSLADIAQAVGGEIHAGGADVMVTGAAFVDSRRPVPGGLFVAIEGEHVDGHDYARQAVEEGAAAVLSRRAVDAPCVVVADPVEALGLLAHHVVSRLTELTVVGITGSQGKTSTKDIVAQLLEPLGETIAPEGSFNNELGVPLTALRATESTRYLVSEMGARGVGHIQYLASMVQPTYGVVLNVGVAHLGEFGSKEEIALAKGELVEALPADGVAILNRDDPLVMAMAARTDSRTITFGESADADIRTRDLHLDENGYAHFTLSTPDEVSAVRLMLVGEHQVANAAAAAAVALTLGMTFEQVVARLEQVVPRSRWRMELATTPSGLTVLNDAYNANPDSMRAALKTLAELGHRRGDARTIAVLGEMRELGAASHQEHDAIGRLVVRLNIDQLVVVGEEARPIHLGASLEGSWDQESVWVADIEAAIRFATGVAAPGDLVLVKASRAAGLEKVAQALLDETETGA